MTQLEYIIYLGIFQACLIAIAVICGLWLIIAKIRKNNGTLIPEQHFRLPKKILLLCVMVVAISFGLCNAWIYSLR